MPNAAEGGESGDAGEDEAEAEGHGHEDAGPDGEAGFGYEGHPGEEGNGEGHPEDGSVGADGHDGGPAGGSGAQPGRRIKWSDEQGYDLFEVRPAPRQQGSKLQRAAWAWARPARPLPPPTPAC